MIKTLIITLFLFFTYEQRLLFKVNDMNDGKTHPNLNSKNSDRYSQEDYSITS